MFTILSLTLTLVCLCDANIRSIPLPKSVQDCYNEVDGEDVANVVESTFSWTCEALLGGSEVLGGGGGGAGNQSHDKIQTSYFQHLAGKLVTDGARDDDSKSHGSEPRSRRKRSVRSARSAGQCVRREYRSLTEADRNRYHAALNALKNDTSVPPNKYDALAVLHTGLGIKKAHDGAGFPGWHRIYILMFEIALREVDPSVCLPYWDSSLDAEMDEPSKSVVWSSRFFGSGHGPVVDGPFANWKNAKGTPLIRNVGSDGELFPESAVDDILSRSRYEDIVSHKKPKYRLEHHHNTVHVFIGGTMDKLDGASFDPIFWMHHAYIDFVFERFRERMIADGGDPEVYPRTSSRRSNHHRATAETGILEGLTQAACYKNHLTSMYRYHDAPTCPDCQSRYLVCNNATWKCIPITVDELNNSEASSSNDVTRDESREHTSSSHHHHHSSSHRSRRSVKYTRRHTTRCAQSNDDHVIQNDFCADTVCDVTEWVAVPVQVVSVRAPRESGYHGNINKTSDIYSTGAENGSPSFMSQHQPNHKTYRRCELNNSVGKVFLTSKGINYDGNYKETVVVDSRLPVSVSTGYTFVKKPREGFPESTVLVRAHDSCGRVCQPVCRDASTGEVVLCSGALAVNSEAPRMYGRTMDEAVLSVFRVNPRTKVPELQPNRFFLTFYCNYQQEFPFTTQQPAGQTGATTDIY